MERHASLKYPVFQAKQPLDKAFPKLFRIEEFKNLLHRENWSQIAKYICVLYDKGTELLQEYPSELQLRKESAAIEAGWKKQGKKWPEEIQSIFDIKDSDVYNATLAFLKDQNHVIWTEIVITEQELFEFQKLRFMSIETGEKRRKTKDGEEEYQEQSKGAKKDVYEAANKKDELLESCEKRIKYLENLYQKFYGDSKSELMNAEFSEMILPETAERIFADIEPPYELETST
jgi:hypothetical protein